MKSWRKFLKFAVKASRTSRKVTNKDRRNWPQKNQDFWTNKNWSNFINWSVKMRPQCKNWRTKWTQSAVTLRFYKSTYTTSTNESITVSGSWRSGPKTSRTQSVKQPGSFNKDKPNCPISSTLKSNSSKRDWTRSKSNSRTSRSTPNTHKSTSTTQRWKSSVKPLLNARNK